MDPLKPLIDALHAQSRLRVWSLVITVFGDLVQHRGGEVSTGRLGTLMSRIGIEGGTLRTALSRLGRDGWVDRARSGRTSLYMLSAQGSDRFAPATSLIYAPPHTGPVSLYVTLQSGGLDVLLRPAGRLPEAADCVVTGHLDHVSAAYRARFLSAEMRSALAALAADIASVTAADLSEPLDAAAARVLLIHRWRRLILRHPEPLPALLPPDAPLPDPRAAVAQAYARISPLAEAWLDQPGPGFAALPSAAPDVASRFGLIDKA